MKKNMLPHLVFSSLYFVLALFTILMLLLSGFVEDFKQMFRLITQPYGVYFIIAIILLLAGILVSLFHFVRVYTSYISKVYSLCIASILLVFVTLLYYQFFIQERVYLDFFSLEDASKFTKEGIFDKQLLIMIADYLFYGLFVLIPCVVYFFNLHFDKSKIIGRIIELMQPNFNVIIGGIFGFSISPFFKNGIIGYIELIFLVLGLLVFIYIVVIRKNLLDSYEHFNLFLLLVVFVTMMITNHSFMDAQSYFEVRKAFYILVLVGWSSGWMMKLKPKTYE
ncbi:hypothetical protein [Helicobacter apodemus]|uniref:Uncharacterized protein n=1 Tax=Helicobacter apodemus TaxID=135569 RepID=A0A2U8FDT9_9HELI|nr:hypothetical protein [Helicobacter apodemus]AWI34296.1 hypothetical protein CDV25_05625 [Helicobacter apodemus]